jgi:hypothetical protein
MNADAIDRVVDEAAEAKQKAAAKAKKKAAREQARAARAAAPIDEDADAVPEDAAAPVAGAAAGAESDEDEDEPTDAKGKAAAAASADLRQRKVLDKCAFIRSIEYGGSNNENRTASITVAVGLNVKKLLLMGMTESVCNATLIRFTPGIGQCFVMERNREDAGPVKGVSNKEVYVQTDGVNFAEIFNHGDLIDLRRIKYACHTPSHLSLLPAFHCSLLCFSVQH